MILLKYNLYSNGKYVLIFIIVVNFFLENVLKNECFLNIVFFLLLFSFSRLLFMFIMYDLFVKILVILVLLRIYFLYDIKILIFLKRVFNFFLFCFYVLCDILLNVFFLIGLLNIKSVLFCINK